ncbi:e3 ubiquitin-protein ligase arih1 [Fusarium langsethiae]|uniref:RBR-type E3 ubiquitin transferase n=1 Tax=Fusarium langsethiae TaxID=179993 RepID=A0A0M9EU29_FUSLA|nr:e3 ubiquitin-protein ligase arih1 [Fusarium langsethiae]GKU05163.1 unnamed protein product [Fusarium langsethiae]
MDETKDSIPLRRSARALGKRPRTEFEDDGTQQSDPVSSAIMAPPSPIVPSPIDITPSSPSVRRANRSISTRECLSCGEDFPRSTMILAPCSHIFCKSCVDHLVTLVMDDESLFPARCCDKAIPVTLRNRFSKQVVAQYQAKRVEFETPDLERVYCSRQLCATFIPPTQIDSGVGHCTHCLTDTCIACKGEAHKGACRPTEEDSQDLLHLAKSTGWKRCGKCGHLIEKSTGCNHMRCLCGYQFCYSCGKNCTECICHTLPLPANPMMAVMAEDDWFQAFTDGTDYVSHQTATTVARWCRATTSSFVTHAVSLLASHAATSIDSDG